MLLPRRRKQQTRARVQLLPGRHTSVSLHSDAAANSNRNSATTPTLSCEMWNQMQSLITRPPPQRARRTRGRTLWSASPRGAARICLLWSSLLSMPDGPFLPHTIPHLTPPTHTRTHARRSTVAPLPSADILKPLSFPNRQRRPSFIKHRE